MREPSFTFKKASNGNGFPIIIPRLSLKTPKEFEEFFSHLSEFRFNLRHQYCWECASPLAPTPEGRLVCSSCGLEVEEPLPMVPGGEQFKGKAPKNMLMADNMGLGTETMQLLQALERKGIIKGYWLLDLYSQHAITRTLLNFTLKVLSEIARFCQQAGFKWEDGISVGLGAAALNVVKREITGLDPRKVAMKAVNLGFRRIFNLPTQHGLWEFCRVPNCTNLAVCTRRGCQKTPEPNPADCLPCPRRLCLHHL